MPFRDSHAQAGDPLVESISSINVARNPDLAHPFDPALLGAPAVSAASKTPKLWAILGLVGALTALASAAVIVSYTRGSLGAARSPETSQPTEASPRPSPTDPSVATPTASEPTPSAAKTSSVTVTPASSTRPTSVSELPAVGPTAKPGPPPSGRPPPKTPSKPADPLKNLGSGLGP